MTSLLLKSVSTLGAIAFVAALVTPASAAVRRVVVPGVPVVTVVVDKPPVSLH
jgi:ABC-type sugar transport system substrate-binding protein